MWSMNPDEPLPDTCEKRTCDEPSRWWVKFTDPAEYVAYCAEHKDEELNRDGNAVLTTGRL
jgi:hypothetical protein